MGKLQTEGLTKRYGKLVVLDRLEFDADPGVTVVTGRSGSGKSTLLRLLATLEKPSSGQIFWDGKDIWKDVRDYRFALGYAPQAIGWPESLTATEFLVHIAALKRIRRADALAQGQALLARVGLGGDADRPIRAYSGGMRRRLGLCQALLGEPQVLLLDEPAAELDSETSHEIHELIFEQAARGATVLMTTHRQDALGDREVSNLFIADR